MVDTCLKCKHYGGVFVTLRKKYWLFGMDVTKTVPDYLPNPNNENHKVWCNNKQRAVTHYKLGCLEFAPVEPGNGNIKPILKDNGGI